MIWASTANSPRLRLPPGRTYWFSYLAAENEGPLAHRSGHKDTPILAYEENHPCRGIGTWLFRRLKRLIQILLNEAESETDPRPVQFHIK